METHAPHTAARHRGWFCGLAVGLCLGLALLIAPSALATPPPATVTGQVNAVVADGSGGYFVGGLFSVVGNASFQNAVHIASDGTLDSAFAPQVSGTVKAITLANGYVYLGGSFSVPSTGGPLTNLARVSTATDAVDPTWAPNPTATVNALAVSGIYTYLGGTFSITSGGTTVNDLARLAPNGTLDTSWNPSPSGTVNTILADGTNVYLGGAFHFGLGSTLHLARVNNSGTLDTNWDPAPDGPVDTLAKSGQVLYVGGTFAHLSGSVTIVSARNDATIVYDRNNAAAVSTTTGLANAWDPNPSGSVNALTVTPSTVYLGGGFTSVRNSVGSGQVTRNYVAGVDAVNGYDTGWDATVDNTINGLDVLGTDVYLGGEFTTAGGVASQSGIAKLTPQYTLTVGRTGTGATAASTVTSTDPSEINCPASCAHAYANGSTVTLTATPAPQTAFTGWSGGCTGTGTCTVSLNADTTVSADFTPTHTVTVSFPANGSGSVTSSPAGLDCSSSCSHAFTDGTQVTLTATPASDWRFAGWFGGGCIGSGSCAITIGADVTVNANFNPARTLTVAPSGSGSGSVISAPAGISCGATCTQSFDVDTPVTLTASPGPGSRFGGWTGGGCSGTGDCSVPMSSDTSVSPIFVAQHTLSVADGGSGSGRVSGDGGAINCGANCFKAYDQGTAVTLTAAPSPGSSFAGWSGGGCAGTGSCTVTMNGDSSVTAMFTGQGGLTVSLGGSGSGSVTSNPGGISCAPTCTAVYPAGTRVTLSARPAAGSSFSGWSGSGCAGVRSCTVTVGSAHQVSARFAVQATRASAPKCTVRAQSSRILLVAPRKRKGKPKVTAGTLGATAQCDHATTATLSGVITELVGKKPRHGKQRTQTFRLRAVHYSLTANRSKTLTLTLTRAALADLKRRAKMSIVLTLSGTGGAKSVTVRVAHLAGH